MKKLIFTLLLLISITTFIKAQVPSYVPTSGLVAWYPLNGNYLDYSLDSIGTILLDTNRSGIIKIAKYFPVNTSSKPENKYNLPVNAQSTFNNLTSGTISLWVKIKQFDVTNHYFGWDNCFIAKQKHGVNTQIYIGIKGGTSKIRFHLNGGLPASSTFESNTSLNLNQWYNITVSWNGTNQFIYINGVLDNTILSSQTLSNMVNPDYLSIGSCGGLGSNGSFSVISDVGFWTRALTATEINALYSGFYYTINASAGNDGSISPSGITIVDSNTIQRFIFNANPGFKVDRVIVDGIKVDSIVGYTFNNITNNSTIRVTFTGIVEQVPSYVPIVGLKGWWGFNGNANDLSGNGNHGFVCRGARGTFTSDRYGNMNRSFLFDGIGDSIRLNLQQNNITTYTITGWFKTSLGGPILSGRGMPNQIGLTLAVHNLSTGGTGGVGKAFFVADASQTSIGKWTSLTYLDNQWHHIAGVFSGITGSINSSQFQIYIDGVLASQSIYTTGFGSAPINNLTNIVIGAHHAWSTTFNGKLDDIGIWNRALTATEVANLFLANDCGMPSCIISSSPRNNGPVIGSTTTLAAAKTLYLGYGAQTMNLNCTASGNAPFTYSWAGSNLSANNIANPVFAPTVGGNYTFTCTVTNGNGCQSTCSIVICVLDIRATGGSPSNPKVYLCHVPSGNPNNPQTLNISISAVPAHLGLHTGDRLGTCTQTCGLSKNNGAIGDLYTEGDVELIVYPNPSASSFTFKLESESNEPIQITIYDIKGRLISDAQFTNNAQNMVIGESLANGIYIAIVKQGNFIKTVKIEKLQ